MGGDSQGEIERGAGVATLLALRATSPYAGGFGDGGTDCHGQCAHWPRNDIGFSWGCGVRRGTWALPYKGFRNIAGGQGRPPLRCCVTKKSVGEGLCPSRGRGNRRSAAGGGCSEPVSRKCPRFADATVAGNRLARRWAREPRPYGSATRGAMGGRPQGSPLRKRCKECDFYRVGRCGERTERCQWQRKRSERVAAVKILSARRKAAQKFWAPQQGHRPLRRVTRDAAKRAVGDAGPYGCFFR